MAPNTRVIEGQPSWRSRAFQVLLRALARQPLQHNSDMTALRQRYERLDARHARVDLAVRREAVSCDGVAAEWISVPETRAERTLLCLHGGSFAFRFPNTHAAFAARLCRKLGARALMPDYRLAPEHPFPAAPDDCQTAYRWLLASGVQPRQVVFVGDSAGGNLALVTLHRARRARIALPACAVLLSPAVDGTFNSLSLVDNANRDPVLHLSDLQMLRRHYVPSPLLYSHPEVSPLFADFSGFPPLLLQTGSTEMLRDEAIRAACKAHAAGVDVELELWPETPHLFQMVPFLPEAAQALTHIAAFVARRTGWPLDNGPIGALPRAGATARPWATVQPQR